ncbi:unnamed protein product [Adineta steineri]|uniref:Uncharacterized protein n=1 Tax=Adineta steineri TaxID=433720 RepID=A0A814KHG8_9BILA|nr:unnamed protein product [Adineta steineri]CAF3690017.1 unnamed protein product [Adineta steineri]
MCERSPLFLIEAKSILFDLLNRTLELFDLSDHFLQHYHLTKFLSLRDEQHRDYRQFSLKKPCKLNYNIISDLNTYLHRLNTTCRLTKSNLRSLHAVRITSPNDYIVIDDEIYELLKFFKTKLNNIQPIEKSINILNRRYYSQRIVHNSSKTESFVFHPEISNQKNNSEQSSKNEDLEEYHQILISFEKIFQSYQFLIRYLYGVHLVRDSHILQPIVVSITRLLLSITDKLKGKLEIISPTKINHNHFNIQQHEEICHEEKKIISNSNSNKNIVYVHNDNHSTNIKEDGESILEFDEDEFYRLANLERDD